MSHLKRLHVPKYWKTGKKTAYWAVSPRSSHKESIPLIVALRDVLGLATTAREARAILNAKIVKIDGHSVKDGKRGLGLMDVVTIADKNYRVTANKGGLALIEADHPTKKVLKVIGKRTLTSKRTQLSFHDGRTVLSDLPVAVGDSVLFDTHSNKPEKVIKLESGATALIYQGTHTGEVHKIVKIEKISRGPDAVDFKDVKTIKDYVLAVGAAKPEVKIQ